LTDDPYLDPQTGVLRNLLGISDRDSLRAAEDLLVSARLAELDVVDLPDTYGRDLLFAIHRHLFQDVYVWAGVRRTVGISKGTDGFMPHSLIDAELETFAELLAEEAPAARTPEFIRRFARLYERLNHIHPFREGNGRAQRAFWELYLREFGMELGWESSDKAENDAACAAGARGDFGPLERLLGRIIGRAR
jgi:cell filamentation protein